MKKNPTEADLELKEVKEAIQILREYCESRNECNNCDIDIYNWCSNNNCFPHDWKVKHE